MLYRLVTRLLRVRTLQRSLFYRPRHQCTKSVVRTYAAGSMYHRTLRSLRRRLLPVNVYRNVHTSSSTSGKRMHVSGYFRWSWGPAPCRQLLLVSVIFVIYFWWTWKNAHKSISTSGAPGTSSVLLATSGEREGTHCRRRLLPGRCITGDYGHVMGCYADVTAYVSDTCDYRQNCTLLVATMDSVAQPCAKDFKSYLQAYYVCVRGLWTNEIILELLYICIN